MCGSFTCSKNTLVGLNVIYLMVSFLIIGVAVHSKVSGIVTDLPIIGGITASGVFLMFISVVGLIGATKHHQVLLFFYMVILFLIFIIQFSCSCAALAASDKDQLHIIHNGWDAAIKTAPNLVIKAEETLDCCGLGIDDHFNTYPQPTKNDTMWTEDNHVKYKEGSNCFNHTADTCKTCFLSIDGKVTHGFKLAGGLGLFFSFPEFIGLWLAARFRNQKDPRANPSAFF